MWGWVREVEGVGSGVGFGRLGSGELGSGGLGL